MQRPQWTAAQLCDAGPAVLDFCPLAASGLDEDQLRAKAVVFVSCASFARSYRLAKIVLDSVIFDGKTVALVFREVKQTPLAGRPAEYTPPLRVEASNDEAVCLLDSICPPTRPLTTWPSVVL